jgi:hypothetical protein
MTETCFFVSNSFNVLYKYMCIVWLWFVIDETLLNVCMYVMKSVLCKCDVRININLKSSSYNKILLADQGLYCLPFSQYIFLENFPCNQWMVLSMLKDGQVHLKYLEWLGLMRMVIIIIGMCTMTHYKEQCYFTAIMKI